MRVIIQVVGVGIIALAWLYIARKLEKNYPVQ